MHHQPQAPSFLLLRGQVTGIAHSIEIIMAVVKLALQKES